MSGSIRDTLVGAYVETEQKIGKTTIVGAYTEVELRQLDVTLVGMYVEVEESPIVSLNTLLLQLYPQNLSIISAGLVSLDTLQLISTLPSATITPSSVTVLVDELILRGFANDVSIQIGAAYVPLSSLLLQSFAQTITISTIEGGRKYGPPLQ